MACRTQHSSQRTEVLSVTGGKSGLRLHSPTSNRRNEALLPLPCRPGALPPSNCCLHTENQDILPANEPVTHAFPRYTPCLLLSPLPPHLQGRPEVSQSTWPHLQLWQESSACRLKPLTGCSLFFCGCLRDLYPDRGSHDCPQGTLEAEQDRGWVAAMLAPRTAGRVGRSGLPSLKRGRILAHNYLEQKVLETHGCLGCLIVNDGCVN